MLYLPYTKLVDSSEAAVAPGVIIGAEGIALVRANNAQANGVMPSTGTSADKFVGFAIAGTSAAPFAEGFTNKVEKFVVPSTGIVTVQFAPVTGQVLIINNATGAVVTGTTVTGNSISGLTSGLNISVTYKYALTVQQARALMGDVTPGGYSGAYVGQIGLARRGLLYTTEFDAAVNWAAVTGIKLAANGQLTSQAGSGVAINAVVVAVPSQDYPYLGIDFSAPGAA
jgi:hypothetical protein